MKVKVITSDVEGALEVVSLTTGLDGMIYGGHTGSKNHLFCELNPATLKIRDLGSKVVSSNELFLNDGKVVNQKIHHALSTLPDGRIAGGTGQNITAFQESFRQKDDEGGHLFVYDPSDEAAVDFGVPVPHEWIINTTVSPDGERVFGMTYLTNTFFAFNIKSGELEFSDQVHGRIFGDSSCTHSIICDLEGNVYGSCRDGRIFIYNSRERELTETELKIPGSKSLRIDSLLRSENGMIYGGVHEDCCLFSIDPESSKLKELTSFEGISRLPALVELDGKIYGAAGGGHQYATRGAFIFEYDPKTGGAREIGAIEDREDSGVVAERIHDMTVGLDGTIYAGETANVKSEISARFKEENDIEAGYIPYIYAIQI